MFTFTPFVLRCFGISGILGSILFILGDILYNHVPGSREDPALKMSRMPETRLHVTPKITTYLRSGARKIDLAKELAS